MLKNFIDLGLSLPGDKQRPDMKLPLKMGRMHVKVLYDILKISCPQEESGDEEDWTAAYPNLCLQN